MYTHTVSADSAIQAAMPAEANTQRSSATGSSAGEYELSIVKSSGPS